LTATQAGAFALTESFLYTTEAFRSYLDHLEDGGILTLTRWYLPSPEGKLRHSLRLFTLAVAGLEAAGIERPGDHILYVVSGSFTVIVIKKTPVTPADIAAVDREVLEMGYRYLYAPDRRPPPDSPATAFYDFLEAKDRKRWLAEYPFDVGPPTDDSPFFFEYRKVRDAFRLGGILTEKGIDGLGILVLLLVETILASAALVAASWRLQSRATRPVGWLYFASIGLGFMLVEVTLSQRLVLFLGHPTYALSVVLFSVLVFSGLGALLSARLARALPAPLWLFAVSVTMLLWAVAGTPLLRSLVGLALPIRIAAAVILIAPAAVVMGIAFPEAVRRVTGAGAGDLGVYWAWNGVASVVAGVLAVIVAMAWGFGAVMVLAAAAYAVAGVALRRLA
jgi:hypothetical protein